MQNTFGATGAGMNGLMNSSFGANNGLTWEWVWSESDQSWYLQLQNNDSVSSGYGADASQAGGSGLFGNDESYGSWYEASGGEHTFYNGATDRPLLPFDDSGYGGSGFPDRSGGLHRSNSVTPPAHPQEWNNGGTVAPYHPQEWSNGGSFSSAHQEWNNGGSFTPFNDGGSFSSTHQEWNNGGSVAPFNNGNSFSSPRQEWNNSGSFSSSRQEWDNGGFTSAHPATPQQAGLTPWNNGRAFSPTSGQSSLPHGGNAFANHPDDWHSQVSPFVSQAGGFTMEPSGSYESWHYSHDDGSFL